MSSHHSVLFGKWNVLIANLRKSLHGRVLQNGHGGPRRALWRRLALEDASLAVRSHGWIDLDSPRRRQRASHHEQSGESDYGDFYGQPAHGFDDLHSYRQLDTCGYVLCWK